MDTLTLFAMTRKGFEVLEALLENTPQILQLVVGSRDKFVVDDSYDEIKSLCQSRNVTFCDRKEFDKVCTPYSMAISWRWKIDLPPEQLIVLHDSLLPRYRGFNPLVSALINGDDKIGVSAIFATDDYDCGDIIAQSSRSISYPIKINEAIDVVIESYRELAVQIGRTLATGDRLIGEPQNDKDATYSLWRDEDDYFLDWSEDCATIRRKIDAIGFPYQNAATRVGDKVIRIVEAEEVDDVRIENRTPGKVIFVRDECPVVVCGSGLLLLKRMTCEAGESVLPLSRFRTRFQ